MSKSKKLELAEMAGKMTPETVKKYLREDLVSISRVVYMLVNDEEMMSYLAAKLIEKYDKQKQVEKELNEKGHASRK